MINELKQEISDVKSQLTEITQLLDIIKEQESGKLSIVDSGKLSLMED